MAGWWDGKKQEKTCYISFISFKFYSSYKENCKLFYNFPCLLLLLKRVKESTYWVTTLLSGIVVSDLSSLLNGLTFLQFQPYIQHINLDVTQNLRFSKTKLSFPHPITQNLRLKQVWRESKEVAESCPVLLPKSLIREISLCPVGFG